jgi:mannose-1-phosphate guanylyltransferase
MMKAMILAAGRGKRLRPITDIYPKVLVPVANKPMIARTINFLKEIIVNAYHRYQMIIDYLRECDSFGISIEIRVEEELLGTGGGIKNTQDFWDEKPFLVINGDILTDIHVREVYEYHVKRNNMVTMVLCDCPVYNKVITDHEMNILSIGSGTNVKGALAFTGIHVINPEVLNFIPENRRYDIIDCYKNLIKQKRHVRAYLATGQRWRDIGTVGDYLKANLEFLRQEKKIIDQDCTIDPGAALEDWAVIGKRSTIERSALIKRSVLWDNVIVREGVRVIDSVVTSGVLIEQDLVDGVAIR